jgi:hypothetical protein
VAATAARLVTLASSGDAFVLRLFEAATGLDAGAVEPPDWPQWAQGGERLDAMQVTAVESADGVRLRWHIHQGYGGGAAPSTAVLADAEQDASGEVIVDLQTGHSTSASGASPSASIDLPSMPAAVPDPPGGEQIGSRRFTLRVEARGASKLVVLALRDASSGASWEAPLGEAAAARPGPLRK